MKLVNIKKLQDAFLGKVCTVLTGAVSKNNFLDQQFSDFFTGIIESIDEDGIFARHHLTGCLNFYNFNYVVGIFQEQVIEESDPKYQEIMEDLKNSPPNKKASVLPLDAEAASKQNMFIDPEMLAKLSAQAKEKNR